MKQVIEAERRRRARSHFKCDECQTLHEALRWSMKIRMWLCDECHTAMAGAQQ